MKICKKCGEKKPLTEFYKDSRVSDGHQSVCKVCARANERKRYWANPEKAREKTRKWAKANPEKTREYERKWREANPEKVKEASRRKYWANPEENKKKSREWREANPERVKENRRNWIKNNPEKKRESDRNWVANNPEKKRELTRNWDKANPEKRKAALKRYEDRKRALPDTLTSQEFELILASYDYLCAYCDKAWQVENRIIPVSQNGGRTKENVVPACKSCSARKHSRTPEQAGMMLKQPKRIDE